MAHKHHHIVASSSETEDRSAMVSGSDTTTNEVINKFRREISTISTDEKPSRNFEKPGRTIVSKQALADNYARFSTDDIEQLINFWNEMALTKKSPRTEEKHSTTATGDTPSSSMAGASQSVTSSHDKTVLKGFQDQVGRTEGKDTVEKKKPLQSKSHLEFDRTPPSRGVAEPLPGREVQSETAVARVDRVRNQIDFSLIRSDSRLVLEKSLSHMITKPGLTGLKEFISSRQLISKGTSHATIVDTDQEHLNKFIDYFIDCDGLRYLGILEQIQLDFEDRCKAALLTVKPNTQAEAEYLRAKLNEIAELQPMYQQKVLREFNFADLLLAEIKILGFNYKSKIVAIQRIHQYALDMEKYWYAELENGRFVKHTDVYDSCTQILAELMGQLFSTLVKSCEFMIKVNEDIKKYRDKYTAYSLIHLFSEFRRLLDEEVSAIGDLGGGVMIRMAYMTDKDIIDIMTKLYSQVNFVDICICKALRAVIPQILLFDCQRLKDTL